MKHLFSDKEKTVVQITDGELKGTILIIKDVGVQMRNLPGRKKSTRKTIELVDALELNDIITSMKTIETPGDIITLNEFLTKINVPKQERF